MNGHQRITATLSGAWPDRRPVMLHNFMMAAREAGISMPQFREDPEVAARAFIQSAEKYEVDGIIIDFDTATLAEAVGVPVDLPEDAPARVRGTLIKEITHVAQLNKIDLLRAGRVPVWLETCRLVKTYFGDELFVRGNCDQAPFSLASMIRGMDHWMIDLLGDEAPVFDLLDYCAVICQDFIRHMAQTGVDMVSNGDSTAGPELISPDLYRKFAWPYEKALVEHAHQLGKPYLLHVCGNTDLIMDEMIGTGADAFELDYKTDIALVCKKMGQRCAFVGNIDPSGVLAMGSRSLVAQKTRALLDYYLESPRLIVNAGCAIPPHTPSENIEEMIKVSQTYKP